MKSEHLIISGKVQGVFYRASAKKKALSLGVTGWVKNTPDNKVEAMVCGDNKAVQLFVEWCRTGPENANVEQVIVTEIPWEDFTSFEVR
jgi:acylphosphatase